MSEKHVQIRKPVIWFYSALGILLLFIAVLWFRVGLDNLFLDTDLGRDLYEMSNISMNRVVWLGPRLSYGFPSSPIYYYMYYPALLISQFDANALIILNSLFTLGIFAAIGILGYRKWRAWSLIAVISLAISAPVNSVALHPGNGYSYVIWLIAGLTGLFFEIPIILSALFIGLAIAFHPAAVFVLPILFYEWLRRGKSIRQFFLICVGLLVPWGPIIGFEIITKGFLLRSYLQDSAQSLDPTIHFQFINASMIFQSFGRWPLVGLVLFLIAFIKSSGKLRVWMILFLISTLFFLVAPPFPGHYLLGMMTIFACVIIFSFMQHTWGKIILSLLSVILLAHQTFTFQRPVHVRSISKLQSVADQIDEMKLISKDEKVAVLAILSKDVSVPQADDYRYFLRVRNYQVLDVVEYSQADVLLLFVEEPGFDWENWSSWERDQFGSTKLSDSHMIDGITLLIFRK